MPYYGIRSILRRVYFSRLGRVNVLRVQIVDKVSDDVDDNMQEVDQGALEKIKVTVSPTLSPREKQLQGHVHMK